MNVNKIKSEKEQHILYKLIEYQAALKDKEINEELLKDLINRYASVEIELVKANKLKNRFLGIAAHDLRNPLGIIEGYSQFLIDGEMGKLNKGQADIIQRINDTTENMLNLINELLDVAMIESGALQLYKIKFPLKAIVEEKVSEMQIAAHKKRIKLIPGFMGATVEADPAKIGQAINNYLSNAIKYSYPDSCVYIKMNRQESSVTVTVIDEGQGIATEDLGKVFGEFQQLSSKPTGGEKSTGLGLFIVRKIIEAHNGNVSVESILGEGSTFSFTLPLTNC